MVWYVKILEKGSLIWHKGGNWSRWTVLGLAVTQIRGTKSIAEAGLGRNVRHQSDRGNSLVTEIETI
jgi:hypothetical protein